MDKSLPSKELRRDQRKIERIDSSFVVWCAGKSGIRLDWKWRLRIAHGAAGGLAYLHELANPPSLTETSTSAVLLLELATARKPLEEGQYVVRQVKDAIDKQKNLWNLDELLDPTIATVNALRGLESFFDERGGEGDREHHAGGGRKLHCGVWIDFSALCT
ncbi:hypothetical protein BHE74_00016550 [Ensete ventricosum]|nr:hypothetical protein BHE74_00016550 [Ensete ventricosum]